MTPECSCFREKEAASCHVESSTKCKSRNRTRHFYLPGPILARQCGCHPVQHTYHFSYPSAVLCAKWRSSIHRTRAHDESGASSIYPPEPIHRTCRNLTACGSANKYQSDAPSHKDQEGGAFKCADEQAQRSNRPQTRAFTKGAGKHSPALLAQTHGRKEQRTRQTTGCANPENPQDQQSNGHTNFQNRRPDTFIFGYRMTRGH